MVYVAGANSARVVSSRLYMVNDGMFSLRWCTCLRGTFVGPSVDRFGNVARSNGILKIKLR